MKAFRIVALVEATSFLILLIASVVKRAADQPLGVEVMGPVHGALFVVYVFMALVMMIQLKWTLWQTVLILAGAVVPLGGYFVDQWLRNHEGSRVQA